MAGGISQLGFWTALSGPLSEVTQASGWRFKKQGTVQAYLTQSVSEVVLQKSIRTKIRQLILHSGNSKGQVDGFVGELTSVKRISKHFV